MAEDLVYRLIDEQVISKREAKLMLAAIDRSTIDLHLPLRDVIRSKILRAMLTTIKYEQQK
ncbi:Transcriptional regulator CtsR [compost metagenome]